MSGKWYPRLAALLIFTYFCYLSGFGGIETGFSHDDLMNGYRGWLEPTPQLVKENICFFCSSPSYRPLGGVFYHVFFNLFGFNGIPYRTMVLFALLAGMVLFYRAAEELSGSQETAALAVLLTCYHAAAGDLYDNSGTCYDIFCYVFYMAALSYYAAIRRRGRLLHKGQIAAVVAMLICALNAKEMAVSLPLMLGFYELLFVPQGQRRYGATVLAGLTAALFCAGRVLRADGLAAQGAYKPVLRLSTYLENLRLNFNEVLYQAGGGISKAALVAVLAAAIAYTVKRRSAVLAFAVLLLLVGILPIAFVPHRSLYAAGIPFAGAGLFLAQVLVDIRKAPAASLVVVAAVLFAVHIRYSGGSEGQRIEQTEIRKTTEELRRHHREVRKGARLLFVTDPFERQQFKRWATLFISRLLYRDESLEANRLVLMRTKPSAAELAGYDVVYDFDGNSLVEIPAPQRAAAVERAWSKPYARPPGWEIE